MSSEVFGDMISLYSRADAIQDGVLIEVDPKLCQEAGIIWPVAVSDRLWGYIEPDNLKEIPGQSIEGRLWDLLWTFAVSKKRTNGPIDRLIFRVIFQMKTGKTPIRQEIVTVIAVCGPGDENEPVITIMLPEDE